MSTPQTKTLGEKATDSGAVTEMARHQRQAAAHNGTPAADCGRYDNRNG